MRNAMWVGGGITGMGEIPMLGVKEKGIAKVIRDIFRNGEQGFFYDPNDLSAMFQDAAGTIPVTAVGQPVGQPVGLMLDKSKGLVLGSNVATGFTSGFFLANSVAEGLSTSIPGAISSNWFPVTPSAFYKIHAPVSNRCRVQVKNASGAITYLTDYSSEKSADARLVAALADSVFMRIYFANEAIGSQVTTFEARKLTGNHAYQNTSAARPILQQTPTLGSELVTDNTIVASPAQSTIRYFGFANRMPNLQAGKTYKIEYTLRNYAGGSAVGLSGNNPEGFSSFSQTADGTYSTVRTITANGALLFSVAANTGVDVVNISVKEVIGYLTDKNYIEYDGVDDKLITNLPAPLTNATVLRAIPNVGTQVKYNQTLPMLYEDSTNHSGLFAIDRALTRFEQLHLMTALDKRAGATSLETLMFKTFDNNQEGFVYDPNDLSTMYKDAAGAVPVTAVGQPVGLMLDKHSGMRDESVTAAGNVSGYFGVSETSEVLLASPTARTTEWISVSPNGIYVIDAPIANRFRVQLKDSMGSVSAYEGNTDIAPGHGRIIRTGPTTTRVRVYYVTGVTEGDFSFKLKRIAGNHAYQTTSASRPILRQNPTTGANYLEFDGSDDFLQTNNIDFTSTDKVSLFAGVRKLSDAATGVVCELGIASVQGFSIYAPASNGTHKFSTRNRAAGTGAYTTSSIYSAPKSVVLSANIDSASSVEMRLNATSEAVSREVSGLTLSNEPVYIGRRGGKSLPFNGHIYGLIGIGKLVSDTETAAIEKELAKRVGVTLNV